ncbi:hypothetical protein RHMOL_Rhmol02G0138700 [Rhododendron molle]|uniref:Uncharacterized protein n=1 Tax=Rhododendron molle TaxID=49168 RepID=A0ACC0PPY7_RHOML|nr:hypothetical protein RHMOL_Rhmol02G0138700 [Rhododendron molle]
MGEKGEERGVFSINGENREERGVISHCATQTTKWGLERKRFLCFPTPFSHDGSPKREKESDSSPSPFFSLEITRFKGVVKGVW